MKEIDQIISIGLTYYEYELPAHLRPLAKQKMKEAYEAGETDMDKVIQSVIVQNKQLTVGVDPYGGMISSL